MFCNAFDDDNYKDVNNIEEKVKKKTLGRDNQEIRGSAGPHMCHSRCCRVPNLGSDGDSSRAFCHRGIKFSGLVWTAGFISVFKKDRLYLAEYELHQSVEKLPLSAHWPCNKQSWRWGHPHPHPHRPLGQSCICDVGSIDTAAPPQRWWAVPHMAPLWWEAACGHSALPPHSH